MTAGEGAAGSTYSDLVLTNTSHHACSTIGYAGVSYVGHNGTQIGAPATRVSAPVRQVLVPPGGRAVATLEDTRAENYPSARCRPATADGLRVYPPNQTVSAFVRHPTLACTNPGVQLLSIAPFH